MWPTWPPSARVVAPVRARVPGDIAVVKKGKERVLDEKHVTQRNSARVSCANRGNSGGFFANASDARGSAVGRLCWAAARDAEWAAPGGAACMRASRSLGPSRSKWAVRWNYVFQFPIKCKCLFNLVFKLNFDKL